MNEDPILITRAQYARHRGKSPKIGKLAKADILVVRGRIVDAAASDAVLDDRPEQNPATSAAAARMSSSRSRPRRIQHDSVPLGLAADP